MMKPEPITLERGGVRLEPLTADHRDDVIAVASDGRLWELWYTSVPSAATVDEFIAFALEGQEAGQRLPWLVRDVASGKAIGCTSYHDIVLTADRVEIGYTFYAQSYQRTHVNTTCKLMLLEHAFEQLGCEVVGLRTDNFNFRSQRAIEALGAKRDGVIRHHHRRKDGSIRDTVMYSILASEWPDVRKGLEFRLARARAPVMR